MDSCRHHLPVCEEEQEQADCNKHPQTCYERKESAQEHRITGGAGMRMHLRLYLFFFYFHWNSALHVFLASRNIPKSQKSLVHIEFECYTMSIMVDMWIWVGVSGKWDSVIGQGKKGDHMVQDALLIVNLWKNFGTYVQNHILSGLVQAHISWKLCQMFTNKITFDYNDTSDRHTDTRETKANSSSFHSIFFSSVILSHSA